MRLAIKSASGSRNCSNWFVVVVVVVVKMMSTIAIFVLGITMRSWSFESWRAKEKILQKRE